MVLRGTFNKLNPYVIFFHYIMTGIIFVISIMMYYQYREGMTDKRLSILENKQITIEQLNALQDASFIRYQDQVTNGFMRLENQISKLNDKIDTILSKN